MVGAGAASDTRAGNGVELPALAGASNVKRAIAWLVLLITRWKIDGEVPSPARYVLIAAPHTTNWDLLHLVILAWGSGVSISWMGKHTLFRGPMGTVMRWLGGIPVRRGRRNDLVAEMAEAFARHSALVLVVPAEATRARAEYWKSGFYRIAEAAKVPFVLGYLDYERKRGGFGPEVHPSGDISADMDIVRAFYADKVGKHPERFGPIRLRDEETAEAESA